MKTNHYESEILLRVNFKKNYAQKRNTCDCVDAPNISKTDNNDFMKIGQAYLPLNSPEDESNTFLRLKK